MTMVEATPRSLGRSTRARVPRVKLANSSSWVTQGTVTLTALSSAALVGWLVDTGKTHELDHRTRQWMRRRGNASCSRAATIATGFGEPVVQIPLSIMTALALVHHARARSGPATVHGSRQWIAASSPMLASVTAILAHHGIKLVFKRRRPPGAWLHGNTEPSFPSGHMSTVTAFTGACAYAFTRSGVLPRAAAPLALVLPCAVGISRVYLDKHWASDILGGFLVGIGIAAASAMVADAGSGPVNRRAEVSTV